MNTFKLELQIKPTQYDETEHELEAKIFIDDKEISDEFISLYGLIESLKQSGEYFIYNCECGVPGCASILDGVKVKHKQNNIHWKLRLPVSYFGFNKYRTYLKTVKNTNFTFDKAEMIKHIKTECERVLTTLDSSMTFDEFHDNTSFIMNKFVELESVLL